MMNDSIVVCISSKFLNRKNKILSNPFNHIPLSSTLYYKLFIALFLTMKVVSIMCLRYMLCSPGPRKRSTGVAK